MVRGSRLSSEGNARAMASVITHTNRAKQTAETRKQKALRPTNKSLAAGGSGRERATQVN